MALEGTGSGAGLLDLTRESDDTSLGAELLDDITPGAKKRPKTVTDSGIGTGVAALAEPRGRAVAAPVMVEALDPSAVAFGAMALGAALVLLVMGIVLASAIMGTRPALVTSIMTLTSGDKLLYVIFGIGFAIAAVFGIVGLLVGKSSR